MELAKLNKDSLNKAVEFYIKDKINVPKTTTFEEYVDTYLKECDCCGEIFIDDDLNKDTCLICESEINYKTTSVVDDIDPQYDYYEEKLIREED